MTPLLTGRNRPGGCEPGENMEDANASACATGDMGNTLRILRINPPRWFELRGAERREPGGRPELRTAGAGQLPAHRSSPGAPERKIHMRSCVGSVLPLAENRSGGLLACRFSRPPSAPVRAGAIGDHLARMVIEQSQGHRTEAHPPVPVTDGLQSHGFADQRLAHVEKLPAPLDLAVGAHSTNLEVPRILQLGLPLRIRPWRSLVPLRRWGVAERLVGPLEVVDGAELIEGPLLRPG